MSVIQARINKLEHGPESFNDKPLGERIYILVQHRFEELTAEERELGIYYDLCHAAYPDHTDPNFEKGKEVYEKLYGDLLPVELEAYNERFTEVPLVPPILNDLLIEKMKEIQDKLYPQVWAKFAPSELSYPG